MAENEDFNWDEYFNEGVTPCSINREIVAKKLLRELAYHEASHFVFCAFAERLKVGFNRVLSIEIHPEKQRENNPAPTGLVHGFGSPYGDETLKAKEATKNWYLLDPKRYYSSLFQSIAGYTSYQVFIENVEHFIDQPEPENYVSSIPYYRIECLPDVSDLKKIQEKLGWKGKTTHDEKVRLITLLRDEVKQIMKIPIVNQSIRFVANRLMKAKGRKIEGNELASIRDKVNRMTKRVSIEPHLAKYETSI